MPSSSSIHNLQVPDLRALWLATNIKLLDPSKTVCQYEVPGGGECRDESCDDVHLGRIVGSDVAGHGLRREMVMEPSDQDTAQYLYNALPSAWRAKHKVQELEGALEEARGTAGHTKKLFEERVAEALTSLS